MNEHRRGPRPADPPGRSGAESPTEPAQSRPAETESPEEAAIRRLIESAGRGPAAPREARERVYARVRATWRESLRLRRRRRRQVLLAAAAAATVAAAALVAVQDLPRSPAVPPDVLAKAVKVQGSVYVIRAGGQHLLEAAGGGRDAIRVGDTLRTASGGRAALDLADGLSLRIDEATLLTFESSTDAKIDRGTAYLDSGAPAGAPAGAPRDPFELSTRFGTVRHLGTQYEASVGDTALHVRVREGSVAVDDGSQRLIGEPGDEIELGETGPPRLSRIETHGPSWRWVEELAAVRGRPEYRAYELARWIARETGRRLEFQSAAVEARARSIALHGVEGLTPQETLKVLRDTTELEYAAEGDSLLVSAGR